MTGAFLLVPRISPPFLAPFLFPLLTPLFFLTGSLVLVFLHDGGDRSSEPERLLCNVDNTPSDSGRLLHDGDVSSESGRPLRDICDTSSDAHCTCQ